MFCRSCGFAVPDAAVFCPACGARADADSSHQGARSHLGIDDQQTVLPDDVDETPDLELGSTVARRYRILERIGAGGTGAVFRAQDTLLDRPCALKVLHSQLAEREGGAELLLGEARLLLELNHPNILRVYDVGKDGERFVLTMELLRGESLREHLRAVRAVSVKDVAEIALGVLGALEYAHRRIVHRDVKPENVFLVEGEHGSERVRLLDFGIALLRDDARAAAAASSGTALYMAPEQRVRGAEVTAAADLYSVGVLLYEALTGSLPTGSVKPPSQKRPGLSTDWDDLVMSLLEESPADRPKSAAEAAATIRAILAGDLRTQRMESAVASPPPAQEATQPAVRPAPESGGASSARVRSSRWVPAAVAAIGLAAVGWVLFGRPSSTGREVGSGDLGRWGSGSVQGESRSVTVAGVPFQFRWIPPGQARLGADASDPCRRDEELSLRDAAFRSGFWMGETEVTQDQWQAVMKSNPSAFGTCGGDCPVESVSWTQVREFLGRLDTAVGGGMRLPTEREWEYAARGGHGGPFSVECPGFRGGDCEGVPVCLEGVAWYAATAGQSTKPVGHLDANAYGLRDVHGNVWEWCGDERPEGAGDGEHVARGGHWLSQPRDVRCAARQLIPPEFEASDGIGLRLLRDP